MEIRSERLSTLIRPIVKDPIFLQLRSEAATRKDLPLAQDLLDTLEAHRDSCVGLAANMVGELRRVIAVSANGVPLVMFNPEIRKAVDPFEAEEGCLSLPGTRKTVRFRTITVRYQDMSFSTVTKTFSGWTAQIIQHELDHCDGVLI